MPALNVLKRAEAAGVTIQRHGNGLRLKAHHAPADELISLIRTYKSQLLTLLPDPCRIASPDAPDLDDFEERAAILEYDAGLTRAEAELAAAREMGFTSADNFRTAIMATWRNDITCLPELDDSDADRLKQISLVFLRHGLALKALHFGWGVVDLWGLYQGADYLRRNDAMGLIPTIAFGDLFLDLVEFTDDDAVLGIEMDAILRGPHLIDDTQYSCVWWRHPAFVGEPGTTG